MEILGFPKSRAFRALWAAEEAGLDYTFTRIEPRDTAADWFRAKNPAGKVPVLIDGDLVLYESAAIATYLGQKVPEKGLVPPVGTPDHGRYLQHCFFVLSELEQPLWLKAKHTFAIPRRVRVEGLEPAVAWEWDRFHAVVDKALGGRDHLVGESFTMADLLLAHTLIWGKMSGQQVSERLVAWVDVQKARPAFRRAAARERERG